MVSRYRLDSAIPRSRDARSATQPSRSRGASRARGPVSGADAEGFVEAVAALERCEIVHATDRDVVDDDEWHGVVARLQIVRETAPVGVVVEEHLLEIDALALEEPLRLDAEGAAGRAVHDDLLAHGAPAVDRGGARGKRPVGCLCDHPACRRRRGVADHRSSPCDRGMSFDPDAAAAPGSGIFGLPFSEAEAAVVLLPVPFDATTSYRAGTAQGPAAILEASHQVDLWDLQTGRAWERGIFMRDVPAETGALSVRARLVAEPILAAGGPRDGGDGGDDRARLAEVDAIGEEVRAGLHANAVDLYERGKIVGVVGGDHGVPLGAIEAASERHPELGILHIDAHMDLRRAYEGFRFSHASIMDNVLERCGERIARLVQVGIRDACEEEVERARATAGRVRTFFDLDVRRRLARGAALHGVLEEIVAPLPRDVWVSFDVDGLDPALCPGTGTPVPGGLAFDEACLLLEVLQASGRRIVGFDLCEVSPRDLADWDAIVGARLLYKLCGFAMLSNGG